jgi:RNA polymerase sigma-70 factor, ECF subfamily
MQNMAAAPSARVEVQVIERAQRGDAQAFEEIYRHYRSPIVGYLCRLVGNPEVAADLSQDVFVNAYQAIGRTQPGLNLKAWLYTIATNAAMSHHRHRRLLQWLPLGDSEPQSLVTGHEDRFATHEQLATAMAALPRDHLACLLLQARAGFSYGEIGTMLGISTSAAKARAYRARLTLASALAATEEGM